MQRVRDITASGFTADDDLGIDVTDTVDATNAIQVPPGAQRHYHFLALNNGSDDPVDYTAGETYSYRLVGEFTDSAGKARRWRGSTVGGIQFGQMVIDEIPRQARSGFLAVEITAVSGEPTGATEILVFQGTEKG